MMNTHPIFTLLLNMLLSPPTPMNNIHVLAARSSTLFTSYSCILVKWLSIWCLELGGQGTWGFIRPKTLQRCRVSPVASSLWATAFTSLARLIHCSYRKYWLGELLLAALLFNTMLWTEKKYTLHQNQYIVIDFLMWELSLTFPKYKPRPGPVSDLYNNSNSSYAVVADGCYRGWRKNWSS